MSGNDRRNRSPARYRRPRLMRPKRSDRARDETTRRVVAGSIRPGGGGGGGRAEGIIIYNNNSNNRRYAHR